MSVEAGVGVDLRDMEACLFRMKKHILTAQTAEQTKTETMKASSSGDDGGREKTKGKAKSTTASKLSALAGDN